MTHFTVAHLGESTDVGREGRLLGETRKQGYRDMRKRGNLGTEEREKSSVSSSHLDTTDTIPWPLSPHYGEALYNVIWDSPKVVERWISEGLTISTDAERELELSLANEE